MSQRKPEERPFNAIKDLSVLPVFFNLNGRSVLVVGDGEGLAWKLELLLASGAEVHFVSPLCFEQFDGTIVKANRNWLERDFQNACVAVGSFKDDHDAERFAQAARRNGTPVNIVDKPSLCDFQFGSIVNRSPVVVSISTAGAAPVLGQLIRSKIETLLPRDLGQWAKYASEARTEILSRLPDAAARRVFWRQFAEAAFTRPFEEARRLLAVPTRPAHHGIGRVTLVGAGPGASDLLTLRAVRAMQSADVILFDDLIADEVLDLARREAKRMLVGKRGGRASCRQEDINALMIKLARQGKHVVRLKSGDPMIFGRAGEELAELDRHNIETEIVPGITTALAAAASMGVSLTHRDYAQGVKFVTAHSRHGKLPDLDWGACADPSTTLMVYMGGRTAAELARRLMDEGQSPQTPIVVMESVSRPEERRCSMTLAALSHAKLNVDAPLLIGIGPAFRDRDAGKIAMLQARAV